jgi:endo-1,4-beta-D-glucanase Y
MLNNILSILNRTIWIGVFIILIGITFFTLIDTSWVKDISIKNNYIFSNQAMLKSLWEGYKDEYIEEGTFRTLDKQRDNITTSEGQSYTMLRAVWQDDKETFDKSWQWTKDNLWKDNKLFAWLFGEREDGTYGVLNNIGGQNAAIDGDSDIAMALLFAYARWNDSRYLLEADSIINAIWDESVVIINGKPYITSNDIEQFNQDTVLLNPSYYAPYAYRMFAVINPNNDWQGVVNTSYEIINQSSASPLDKDKSVGLPPDWVIIDRKTGELRAPESTNITTNYSFDAHRVMWRLYLDYLWYGENRAKQYFQDNDFLLSIWNTDENIYNTYSHNGEILDKGSSPAVIGTNIGYFALINPTVAKQIYEQKLLPLYNRDTQQWREQLGYYDTNWAWFGLAIYNNLLPNYFATLSERDIIEAYK